MSCNDRCKRDTNGTPITCRKRCEGIKVEKEVPTDAKEEMPIDTNKRVLTTTKEELPIDAKKQALKGAIG